MRTTKKTVATKPATLVAIDRGIPTNENGNLTQMKTIKAPTGAVEMPVQRLDICNADATNQLATRLE